MRPLAVAIPVAVTLFGFGWLFGRPGVLPWDRSPVFELTLGPGESLHGYTLFDYPRSIPYYRCVAEYRHGRRRERFDLAWGEGWTPAWMTPHVQPGEDPPRRIWIVVSGDRIDRKPQVRWAIDRATSEIWAGWNGPTEVDWPAWATVDGGVVAGLR